MYINDKASENPIPHYHGDIVRILFMIAAIIMLVSLPLFKADIALPPVYSIVAILILGLTAGLTNPKLIWHAGINLVVAVTAFLVFATYMVNTYGTGVRAFFFTNMVLSFIFVLAVYFSVKTVRGLFLARKTGQTNSGR